VRVSLVFGKELMFDKKRRCIASTTTVVAAESVHGRHVSARAVMVGAHASRQQEWWWLPARQTEPKIPFRFVV
jgi:hypothetical protein